mmetsp:Transcript_324/g.361  ORF Transcript_324/g.361 Transcript_324/m.361 type:complete len:129 (+) Transcript_324:1143-1529(+)
MSEKKAGNAGFDRRNEGLMLGKEKNDEMRKEFEECKGDFKDYQEYLERMHKQLEEEIEYDRQNQNFESMQKKIVKKKRLESVKSLTASMIYDPSLTFIGLKALEKYDWEGNNKLKKKISKILRNKENS